MDGCGLECGLAMLALVYVVHWGPVLLALTPIVIFAIQALKRPPSPFDRTRLLVSGILIVFSCLWLYFGPFGQRPLFHI